jgi:hypothetical protein
VNLHRRPPLPSSHQIDADSLTLPRLRIRAHFETDYLVDGDFILFTEGERGERSLVAAGETAACSNRPNSDLQRISAVVEIILALSENVYLASR